MKGRFKFLDLWCKFLQVCCSKCVCVREREVSVCVCVGGGGGEGREGEMRWTEREKIFVGRRSTTRGQFLGTHGTFC